MRDQLRRTGGAARRLAGFLFLAAALTGCRSTIEIGKLLDDPARYEGRTVRVVGDVTGSVGGLGRGAYFVSDDTGTLPVVSERTAAPRTGARVGVEGRFRSVFTLGTESLAVLEETNRFEP